MKRAPVIAFAGVVMACASFACGTFLASNDRDDDPDAGPSTDGDAADGGDLFEGDGSAVLVDDGGGIIGDASDSIDGGSGIEAGAGCPVKFCSRFDDTANVPFNWGRLGPSSPDLPASLGTRTDQFVSPPRSFRVRAATNAQTQQWLEKTTSDATSGSVSFKVWIDSATSGVNLKIFALNCESGGDAAQIRILGNRTIELLSNGSSQISGGTNALATWIPITLTFAKQQAGTSNVNVTLQAGSGGSNSTSFSGCTPPLKFRLGATTAGGSTWDVSFDDVLIDWKP